MRKKIYYLPQAQLVPDIFQFIQDQVTVFITEDWVIRKEYQDNLVDMRYFQIHKEKIIPQMKLHLTIMTVNFTCLFLAVKNL